MNQIVDALGLDAVRALSALVGGRSIRIPSMSRQRPAVEARERLVALVGAAMAEDLITHFSETRVYFPRLAHLDAPKRGRTDAAVIAKMTAAGATATEIAKALACSERTVFNQRAKMARATKGI